MILAGVFFSFFGICIPFTRCVQCVPFRICSLAICSYQSSDGGMPKNAYDFSTVTFSRPPVIIPHVPVGAVFVFRRDATKKTSRGAPPRPLWYLSIMRARRPGRNGIFTIHEMLKNDVFVTAPRFGSENNRNNRHCKSCTYEIVSRLWFFIPDIFHS